MLLTLAGRFVAAPFAMSPPVEQHELQTVIDHLHRKYVPLHDGHVATYIPELRKADPDDFGVCLVTAAGDIYGAGDSEKSFTIQSISKPLTFGMAIEELGPDKVSAYVGVEPSGDAFNSIELQSDSNRPHNPMINAGAITVSALLQAQYGAETFDHILDRFSAMAGTLSNLGVNPVTDESVFSLHSVKAMLSIMFTCGMYDYAGQWAYRVGVPAKSGVGGGVMAVVNRQLGIGTYSPRLDRYGNSRRGVEVCRELAARLGLHVFDCLNVGSSFLDAVL